MELTPNDLVTIGGGATFALLVVALLKLYIVDPSLPARIQNICQNSVAIVAAFAGVLITRYLLADATPLDWWQAILTGLGAACVATYGADFYKHLAESVKPTS